MQNVRWSLLCLFLLVGIGCEKEIELIPDLSEASIHQEEGLLKEQFFEDFYVEDMLRLRHTISTRELDPLIEIVKNRVQHELSDQKVLKKWINKYGYLSWSSAKVFASETGGNMVVIPTVKNNDHISAILIAIEDQGSTNFHLVNVKKLKQAAKKENADYETLRFSALTTNLYNLHFWGFEDKQLFDFLSIQKSRSREIKTRCTVYVFYEEVYKCIEYESTHTGMHYDNSYSLKYGWVREEVTIYSDDCDGGGGGYGSPNHPPTTDDPFDPNDPAPGGGSSTQLYDYEYNRIGHALGFSNGSKEDRFFRANYEIALAVLDNINNTGSLAEVYDAFEENLIPSYNWSAFAQHLAVLKYLKSKRVSSYKYYSDLRLVFIAAQSLAPSSQEIHTGLDIIGLLPIIGEAADFTNAALYLFEGDKVNATVSVVSSVPIIGWVTASSKLMVKAVKTSSGTIAHLKIVKGSDGLLNFGNRSQLKTMIKPPLNHQAHHIIPWEMWNHDAVQKAAKSGDFHLNAKANGLPIHINYHNGSHYRYNNEIRRRLNLLDLTKNPENLAQNIIAIQQDVADIILSNPTTKINDLF